MAVLAMASSPSTLIAGAALLVSGCAIGLMLGRWTTSPSPPSEHESTAISLQPDFAPMLGEIRRSNDAVLQAIRERHDPQSAAVGTREPAVTDLNEVNRLATAVEKLNGLLARGAGGGWIATEQLQGPGYPTLEALWARTDALASTGGNNWLDAADTELTRAHHLWAVEDLLHRYGQDMSVHANGMGLEIQYRRPNAPKTEAEPTVLFGIDHGLVIGVAVPR